MVEAATREERLIATLHAEGVPLLTGAVEAAPLPLDELIRELVSGEVSSRARSCLVPLLLVHPELAATVSDLHARLGDEASVRLRLYHTAAVLLQRKWRTRLELALGPRPPVPDLFGVALGLPLDGGTPVEASLEDLERMGEALGAPAGLVGETESLVLLLMERYEAGRRT